MPVSFFAVHSRQCQLSDKTEFVSSCLIAEAAMYIISKHLRVFVLFLEATIRFLKAKLRVMQEELDRVVAECNKKVIIIVASFIL